MSTSRQVPHGTHVGHGRCRPARANGSPACPYQRGRTRHNPLTLASTADAASTASATASAPARPLHTLIPPIPPALQADLAAARASWLDRCISSPLFDAATNSRVHLCGIAHFAPHGGPAGLSQLADVLDVLRPSILAIEQPFDLAARAGLPYPTVISELRQLLPAGAQLLSGSGGGTERHRPPWGSAAAAAAAAAATQELRDAAVVSESERLGALLPGLAVPARVGRDLLDPFEAVGLYGGSDYVTRPGQLAEALGLFGWLPGLEYAAVAARAEELGVQVYSVDAPLRLQEQWVAALLAGFSLREEDLPRRLAHDLGRLQALLPASYGEWDAALAEAVRRLEAAPAPPAPPGASSSPEQAGTEGTDGGSGGGGGGDGDGDGDVSGGGGRCEPSLRTVTAFKVSRAVAAATLPYDAAAAAFRLQAGLQPLKWGLFARRARHLVLQVRDLVARMSVRQVRVDAGMSGSIAAGGASETRQDGSGSLPSLGQQVSFEDASGRPEQVVLVVVGRQYVPYIEEMWANERSALWHGDVPRTFAPSKLDR